jgi:hypothetical protein
VPQEDDTGSDTDIIATKVALTLAALTRTAQVETLTSPTTTAIQPVYTKTPTHLPTETAGPTVTQSPTQSPTITKESTPTPTPAPGTIEGNILSYPYGSVPSLVVVAYLQNSITYWYVITSPGNTFYSMTDPLNKGLIKPGSYQVVAYDASGNSGGCTTIVTVFSDQTVTCNITDWGGGYPAKRSDIPSP